MSTKDRLASLVERYQTAKARGQLSGASEATMRTWIDELLSVFGWDVHNTHQVLTERTLGAEERARLNEIGSKNSRPDYTLVNGNMKLLFVDAKSLSVDVGNDRDAAFQIRSYGWSIGASYSIVTNFEKLAVYNCSQMPRITDEANFALEVLLTCEQYVDKFDTLRMYLSRDVILSRGVLFVARGKGEALDERFSILLSKIRIELAKAIITHNDITDVRALSFYVQTIIDRVLFIRVCESRGLEVDELLKQFAKNGFWEEFKKSSYADFFDHYDGPMFRKIPSLHELNIPNEVFDLFLSDLYYPSPYRFDVIPLKTLSDIYDLYLGYQLVVRDGKVSDELKEEFKKSNGAVTTPANIVNQVIESTMPENIIRNLSIKQLLELNIIDIACGSGVFLIGMYDYLVKQIERKIIDGENVSTDFALIIDGQPVLTIEGRKAIINSCLYGVDINPEAVEVAKMSLSLKLIDRYEPKDFDAVGLLGSQILKGVGANIRCGNSLVGSDIEQLYPWIADDLTELQATNAFDWTEAFPDVFSKGGFDYVIGNPPYVEVKNYNVNLPMMAIYIKDVYNSSKNGKIDLAVPFIEKGVRLLNPKGRLGYIVQKRFFKTTYGKGIRKLLTNPRNYLLNGVYDYVETDLFAGRTTYVAVLVCDKNSANNAHVWYMRSDTAQSKLLAAKSLTENPWNFEDAQLGALRLRLAEQLGTLKDVCHVKVGVQVLWNDAFQIHVRSISNGMIHGYTVIDDDVTIELGACKPLLCNEQFAPLSKREYTTFALFPYSVTDDGKVTELSVSDFSNRYPLAGAYLAKHKDLICRSVETLPLKNGAYNDADHWHLFTRANNHGAVYEKICVPMTAQYPQAAVVMDKHVYCDNANMFFIQIENLSETRLYALAGIINSTIFNTLARSIANPQRGGYYKFNKQFLDPVPVPKDALLNCNANVRKLAKIAKQIETLNEQIKNSIGGQTSGLHNSLKAQWRELDSVCDKLYGIKTAADKAILYSTIRNDRNPYGQED